MSRHIRRVAIVAVVGDDKLYTYNSSSGIWSVQSAPRLTETDKILA